ncbi:proteasome subunit alpha [Litorihabitans aurantiacus]|uniref:Proteasome subunit alpha n=1 Tax=Litorihabitans aurantiacus TaxID=1930061 RepID=A0AA37UN81_9MICO|nr:proteasome subunit alpha [Litorihabitans aurantiacus]GMA31114.1 proteasome subunit alpha [Litorihabitans aurantiacus]
MSLPFYVSPEQMMKDRADYARKGVARGRAVVALTCADGIVFTTHNPSRALHKISEIYDRIAFAGVGKYHEFESLRVAGIRYADLRGYAYDRSDVSVRGLASSYAQTLGTIFTAETKPYEVELVVAEVGARPEADQLYRLSFDGTLAEESHHVVIGGQADLRHQVVAQHWRPDLTRADALRLALRALEESDDGATRAIPPGQLEAAVLDRGAVRRSFRRLDAERELAGAGGAGADPRG